MKIPLIYPVFKPFTEFSRDIFSYLFLCRTPDADKTVDRNRENIDGNDEKGYFDYDAFWKDLVDRFSHSLFKRALPKLYEDADLRVKPTPLNTEFTDILNTGDKTIHVPSHFADSVMAVQLKNGETEPVIVHSEAQGPGGGNLAERMNLLQV